MTTDTIKHTWGAPVLPTAIIAWGARTIFNSRNEEYPLDILWDRQSVWPDVDNRDAALCTAFLASVNEVCFPAMKKLAVHFRPDSSEKFVRHFPWLPDPALLLVASGSPNGSHGYFYIGVSLVPKADAPAEIRPDLEAEENSRRAAIAGAQWDREQLAAAKARREMNKVYRVAAKAKEQSFLSRITGLHRIPGERLSVGDGLTVNANQADRSAVVVAVTETTALVEYQMKAGRTFKWEVERTSHDKLRNILVVPKRFQ